MAGLTPASLLADAETILGLFGSGVNADAVAVFDSTSLRQVFQDARPLKATVRETSRVMQHPAENGVMLSDYHIINQVEIDLALMISAPFYGSVYQEIRDAFYNATKLSVQTRTGVYPDMIVADLPHEETADVYDAVTMAMHLKQVLYVPAPPPYSPADPANSNTALNGLQTAASLTKQALATASGLASYASLGKFS